MAKASPAIVAFNGGEWSPLLESRSDLAAYSAGAYWLRNWIPTIQGPIVRRAGTGFIRQVKDTTDRTWLVPFIKGRSDAVMIEFGDSYCRFYIDRAPVLTGSGASITGATSADPIVVTTSGAHGYSNGQDVYVSGVGGMTEVNGRWFRAANVTSTTFELTTIHGTDVDGSGYGSYTSGGTVDVPYEIASPYSAAALVNASGEFNLDFTQDLDTIYIVDRAGTLAPRKLSRSAATSWAFTTFDPDDGPFLDLNSTSTTMYVSAATGTITITASSSVFTANDVGSLIRIDQENLTATKNWESGASYTANDYVRSSGHEYQAANTASAGTTIPAHTQGTVTDGTISDAGVNWAYTSSGYGIARITAQSGTTATATVLTRFPQTVVGSGNATTLWRRGAWSLGNGYPTTIAFFLERLCFGFDQRLDMSEAGSEGFAIDAFGEVLPESAVSVDMPGSQANEIVGLTEGPVLVVQTEGTEFIVDKQSTAEPFGPNNIRVSSQTVYGSRPIRPVRAGDNVLFVQGSGRKVRGMQYSFDVDRFIAPDLLVRAEHLGRPAITALARQEEPYQLVWARRSDGVLLSLTFDPTQEVRGWARHGIAGTDANVECLAVIPSPDGDRDDVWMITSRTINGATRRYIEYLQPEHLDDDDQEDAAYGDCGLRYDGTAATTIHGFDHLEGETLGILSDGAAHADVVVSAGTVEVTAAASVIYAGLRYNSDYGSLSLDAGAKDGTSLGKTKRITDCTFRVVNSRGGKAGPSLDNLDPVPGLNYRAPSTPMGTPPPLTTGYVNMPWPAGYEVDARIWFRNDTMFPDTLAAALPQVMTQESR